MFWQAPPSLAVVRPFSELLTLGVFSSSSLGSYGGYASSAAAVAAAAH